MDRYIRLRSLPRRFANFVMIAADFPFRRWISSRTVLRQFSVIGISPRRPYLGPYLTRLHLRQCLDGARWQFKWTIRRWGRVLFTDMSRFLLQRVDGRAKCFADVGRKSVKIALFHMIVMAVAV